MNRWSLKAQLLAMGLVTALGPLLILLFVVVQVEDVEVADVDTDSAGGVSVSEQVTSVNVSEGVSPLIPVAALALAIGAMGLVWFLTRRAIDPIERMTVLSDEVQAGSLDRRMNLDDAPVEIRKLAESFDRMLDRLATSSALERQLIEDASHELRTPLAALAARLEVAGRRLDSDDIAGDDGTGDDMAGDLRQCEAEVERLQQSLDALLASARSRQSVVEQVDNDVVVLVNRVVERQRLLTPDAEIQVQLPAQLRLGIEGAAVERAIANLVSNAIEHGSSPVTVEVRDGDIVEIIVTDHGPGITPDRLPRIFDRYDGEHHGIGLAIVKQVADAYGNIQVESPVDGSSGARFTLSLHRV